MLGFLDLSTILSISHVFGVILGAGGAFVSDFIFFSSVRDEKISETELRFLKLGSKIVWIGLAIIVISGAFLFFEDMPRYLHSSKFLAKMTIVAVIIANGFVFHLFHIPHLHRHMNAHLPSSDEFVRKIPLFLVSGTLSVVSWLFAFVLGSLRSVPYAYGEIISIYLIVLGIALLVTFIFRRYLLPASHREV